VEFLNVKQGVLLTAKRRCIKCKYQWRRDQ